LVEIKKMPFKERYEGMLTNMKVLESWTIPIVKEQLGDSKVDELKSIWQKQAEPIPEDASYEEKWEIAYRNWMRNWISAYDFVRNELGECGIEKFIRRGADAWKKATSGPALHVLNFVRAISPQTAFRTFGKQIAYTWQSLDDYSIPEFTGKRMVLTVSHCKGMDVKGCETVCKIGCKKLLPLFLNEQFKVKATFEPAGKSCTITLTPL
jgi:hypothetical protein